MKTTTTIQAGSAIQALDNVRTWYKGLDIKLACPPTCRRVEKGAYDVTVRMV